MAVDRSRNIKVILDTNALLMPFQFKINIDIELTRLLGHYEIIIPSSVLDELRRLSQEKKSPPDIGTAIKLAGKYNLIHTNDLGDEAIFNMAEQLKAMVVTNDKLLKKRLWESGLQTISLRSKNHLVLD